MARSEAQTDADSATAAEAPPILESWGRIYALVLAGLALVVLLLAALTWIYS